ncbi:MAG: hypothetical protein M3R16_07185 [Pseudomonadota bacterium]|nr:hypothetical protein [Pseudomonadota bacterium]
MKKLLYFAALVVVLIYAWKWARGDTDMSLVQVEIKNPYPATSPLYAASQEFVAGVNANDKLRSRFAGTFTKGGLYSEMRTALKRGAQSLDGPVLVGATTAMARVVPHLSTPMCARMFRDNDVPDPELNEQVSQAFAEISPAHYSRLMRFYLMALQAEVSDAPIKPLDQAALRSALNNLGSQFQGEFGQRFTSAMQSRESASDEDLCWAGNTLLHGITLMEGSDREILSRWGMAGK